MAFTYYRYGYGSVHHLSERRILLVGNVKSGKSFAGNAILGRDTFSFNRNAICVKRHGTIAGRKITLVEAPGWWNGRLVEESTKLLKQEIVLSVLQCPPGPHAVLPVVRLDIDFEDADRQILEGHLDLLGDQVWNHTIVLFTFGDSLGNNTIEQHIENKGKALKLLVEKCGNRYHVFMNDNRNPNQIRGLLEKIEKMLEANRRQHFEIDAVILRELEARRKAEEERSMERRMKVSKKREGIRKHMSPTHHYAEINILLLGCRNAGKSSAGNIILRREGFNLNRAVECVKREGNSADRKLTVVEAPGWWRERPVEESTELLKQEIFLSVSQCPPGPHAVLVVVNGDRTFKTNDREILTGYLMLLGDKVWSHTMVLFTFGDSLGDTVIERHIESEGEDLQWVVEQCGNRYHVFNIQKMDDDFQVKELLEKIEEMMAENRGSHLELNTKILLKKEDRRREELERSMERMFYTLKHREGIQSHMSGLHHFSELRIVLLGCRNSGKSSTGNTILRNSKFEFNSESTKCVKRQENVSGRKITVVEAPGWSSDIPVEESTESLKQEIVLSASMCPPGPHAVLVVVNGDRIFTEKDKKILAGYMKLLGDKIWSHAMVLFTFGDALGDTTIERHIESEGEDLQWLVEKCRNRYHVFNNKKTDEAQVTELLEKIEVMLAGNRCYHFEKEALREIEEEDVNGVEEERLVERPQTDRENMYTKTLQGTEMRREKEVMLLEEMTESPVSVLQSSPSFNKHVGTEVISPTTDVSGAAFVDHHSDELIQRVSSVMEIADCLKSKNMITQEMYNRIQAAATPQDKMRELYNHLNSQKGKEELYHILKKKQGFLVEELESGRVQANVNHIPALLT